MLDKHYIVEDEAITTHWGGSVHPQPPTFSPDRSRPPGVTCISPVMCTTMIWHIWRVVNADKFTCPQAPNLRCVVPGPDRSDTNIRSTNQCANIGASELCPADIKMRQRPNGILNKTLVTVLPQRLPIANRSFESLYAIRNRSDDTRPH
jgi:hypothetical protein